MASITVCDRTNAGVSSRKKIHGLNLASPVNSLKASISQNIGKQVDDFDLIYCGQCLKEDSSLESLGIHSGSTVHALLRHTNRTTQNKGGLSNNDIKLIRTQLEEAIANPAYKPVVESILSNPEEQNEILSAVPGLREDITALTLFYDVELVDRLSHPGNIRRVIETHPCFPDVARKIAEVVKNAGAKGEYVRSSTTAYSLDQMSDDEDSPGTSQNPAQPITANQLAAALAAATGAPGPSQLSPQSQPIASSMITPDFFQQAISQAQSSAMGNQIQRMREMGITDENVAREALQATHGDLQAAIDLIFSGGLS